MVMEWKVPLFDLQLGEDELEAVRGVIRSKWLTMGEMTREFEQRFAEFIDSRQAIAVTNGTAALHLALLAAGIGEGDDVVCPSLTFVATANAIRYCGAHPVFADVTSWDNWNVSAATIESALTPATKAVIVVHYGGYPCNMTEIRSLCLKRGLVLLEDVAHAPGASLQGRMTGTWSDVGCFSFFSNKNMTTGEGGMITTDRADIAEKIRSLRSHGMTTLTLDRHKGHAFSYDVVDLGYNYRMGELNAALGLVQLKKLRRWNEDRKRLTHLYRLHTSAIPGVKMPFEEVLGESACHILPILLPDDAERARVMEHMRGNGIQTSIHYQPVDMFTAYRDAGLGPSPQLPYTHTIGRRTITLPLYPNMSESQINLVCDSLSEALRKSECRS